MPSQETGLLTLIKAKRVPETPHFPEIDRWDDVLAVLDSLATGEHDRQTLVLDTINGIEKLCHQHVTELDFAGDVGEKGFQGYGRGYRIAISHWKQFINRLDVLRRKRKMSIVALVHTKVKTFKNPEGPDFDRYVPDLHDETWSVTARWADIVGFMTFVTVVDDEGKGRGGQQRVLYTERHAAYDAKNRFGLPEMLDMGSSGEDSWGNFYNALRTGKA